MIEVAGHQSGQHGGVGGVSAGYLVVVLVWVALAQHLEEVCGVGQVAVVGESHGAGGGATSLAENRPFEDSSLTEMESHIRSLLRQ